MKRYFFLIFVFFHAATVFGQMKLSFNSNSFGARANVLHSGYVGVANDYASTHWNPAGMVTTSDYLIGASSAILPFDQQLNLIALILPVGNIDRIGISWAGYFVNNIEARQNNSDMPDYIFELGEQSVWLSYAHRFGNFSFGANAKYLSFAIDRVISHGYGLDVGGLLSLKKKWQFGFAAYDVLAKLYWGNGLKENFQKLFRSGVSYLALPNWSLIGGIEMYHINHPTFNLYFATEYQMNEKFDIKIGIHPKRIAVGIGFNQAIGSSFISFNYAVQTNPILNYQLSHLIDIQFNFQKRIKKKEDSEKFRKEDFNKLNYAEIIADWANVRVGPGLNYPIITKVYIGERFIVLGQQRDDTGKLWWKIRLGNNQIAWIRNDLVKVTEY